MAAGLQVACHTELVECFGRQRALRLVSDEVEVGGGLVVACPRHLCPCKANVEQVREEVGRQIAEGAVMISASPVQDHDGWGPDDALLPEVGPVLWLVEQEPDWDEVLDDEAMHDIGRIRHGIQRFAARSVSLAEVGQQEAAFLASALQGYLEVNLPFDG